ncbi:Fic family protein [Streptomyces netropsis]|uniref:Fic family protein n=1 Tax=Streptomyces netropsis TaxID=55404 RepID=UPI0030CFD296
MPDLSTAVRSRSPARSRAGAARKRPLAFTLLAEWQRLVLGVPGTPFRQGDAFAKGGRERYALTPRTRQDFAGCLRQSGDREVPLAARAARAYLDVAFFHPFSDGNARLALLALAYVLERDGVRLDRVGPLQTARYADDSAGAVDLVVLLAVLIRAAHRRAAGTPHVGAGCGPYGAIHHPGHGRPAHGVPSAGSEP